MRFFVSWLFITLCHVLATAQDKPAVDMEEITDNYLSFPDADVNYEEQYENLTQLLAHPINLNQAKAEDLRSIKLLSELQIQKFLTYRDSVGPLLAVYELQAIPSFNEEIIAQLSPFVTVPDPYAQLNTSLWNRIKKESNNYLILRADRILEDKEGFSTTDESTRFKGSPYRMYTCFRSFRAGDFSVGFTLEKDAGESWQWSAKQPGLDYIAWHVQIQNKGRIKNLIVGDFQSQFAQGIMYGGIFGMGKGGEPVLSIRKSSIGFLPYTSAYEAGSLKGIATTIELRKKLLLSAFLSSQVRDANTEFIGNEEIVTSRITTGMHRNANELLHRKNLKEQCAGFVLHYKTKKSDGGILFNTTTFNKRIILNETLYNQYYFQGKQNNLFGGYFNYTINQASVFSEITFSTSGEYGMIGGLLTSLSRKLDFALLYRSYSKGFTSFYTNALAENSTPRNESAMYWGWKYTWNRKVSTAGYMDIFTFPWLRYRSYKPSYGYEWLLRVNYQPSRKIVCFVQVRSEQKERNVSDNTVTYLTQSATKTNYWIASSYEVTSNLKLKTRAQFSTYTLNNKNTTGIALIQDLQLSFNKLEITARYALFDTDDYDNRQYVYENDVWLAYSLPAYSGIGTRRYLQAAYKFNSTFSMWVRYAQFQYRDKNIIGGGIEEIKGNTKSELKLQLKLSF